jgi:DNA-binding MarR family transcriptional regulator
MPMGPTSIDQLPRRLTQWPTWLLGRLHHDGKKAIGAGLAELDMSLPHYAVLACIAEFEPLSQQQVCERLAMDRADMVGLVDHLERDLGAVVRTRDEADRRRYILTTTPEGRELLARADESAGQASAEYLSVLTPDEIKTMTSLALRVLAAHDR